MALTTATITYALADLVGVAHYKGTSVTATTNIPGDTVIDTDGDLIRLGSGRGTIAADGTGSIDVWVPGVGSNPASWQTYIHVRYRDPAKHAGHATRTFGPFTITASGDLADLVAEQEVPPEYASGVLAEMQALRDETSAISGLTGEDEAIALLVGTPASETATALSATFVAPVNVRAYGATGDGTTDDTAAIDAAQVAARSANRPLYFPAGTYAVAPASGEAAVTLTTEGAKAGITHCYGDGPDRTIIKVTSTAGRGVDLGVWGTHFLEITPITLRDLKILGPGSGTGVGLRIRNASKGKVRDVEVNDFGSYGVDQRNANSWNFHNLRVLSNGAQGWFGNYATSRDTSDPGLSQAENNSANHACSWTGTTLIEDNGSHGFDMRAIFDLAFHGVCQRNAGRGMWLQDVSGFQVHVYTEDNSSDGVKLGNSAGGINTACKYGTLTHFAAKGANQAASSRTALWMYAATGVDARVYTGAYTLAGDYGCYLETSFQGTLAVRHSGGSGGFVRTPGNNNLTATSDLMQFGIASPVVVTKTANYTIVGEDVLVIASGAGTTITLPSAATSRGRTLRVKRNDATNSVTVNTAAGLIDGASTVTLSTNKETLSVISDGTGWFRI